MFLSIKLNISVNTDYTSVVLGVHMYSTINPLRLILVLVQHTMAFLNNHVGLYYRSFK
jgi:hypothetical protein